MESKTKEVGEKTIKVKTIVAVVAVIVVVLAVPFVLNAIISRINSRTISNYIQNGDTVTYTLNGFGSRLSVVLASTNDYMYVKIVIDGQTVYDKNNIYQVNFQQGIELGVHTVQIIIQNPGLGSNIQVSGQASVSLW